ncbi:hypothetical protein LY10_00064 [Planktotalea frisia]|uniref:Uncharacterized protein n=1 Tax=Planktotalea frisia TaxID=696762 RepID=A0A1L9NZK0_9RHOB|nr:hypothetical protein [Planktotalea frisia]MCO4839679.1 hypothetical protein [Paracoccaceae bacterium]OJI94642.1 hypothetical protein PFRI_11910 [Planktotalea frisia]PZX35680.1 hypothetical protein LY10_00064 [Planktotalea frisia]
MNKLVLEIVSLGMAVVLAIAVPMYSKHAQMDISDLDHDVSAMASEGAEHDHPVRPVDPIPSVTHLAYPDAMDGYNVQILTPNFAFTPAAINLDVVEG